MLLCVRRRRTRRRGREEEEEGRRCQPKNKNPTQQCGEKTKKTTEDRQQQCVLQGVPWNAPSWGFCWEGRHLSHLSLSFMIFLFQIVLQAAEEARKAIATAAAGGGRFWTQDPELGVWKKKHLAAVGGNGPLKISIKPSADSIWEECHLTWLSFKRNPKKS